MKIAKVRVKLKTICTADVTTTTTVRYHDSIGDMTNKRFIQTASHVVGRPVATSLGSARVYL